MVDIRWSALWLLLATAGCAAISGADDLRVLPSANDPYYTRESTPGERLSFAAWAETSENAIHDLSGLQRACWDDDDDEVEPCDP